LTVKKEFHLPNLPFGKELWYPKSTDIKENETTAMEAEVFEDD